MSRSIKRQQKKLARKAGKKASVPVSPDPHFALLQKGAQAFQAGRAKEAQEIYHQVLKASPDHAEANHMMSVFAYQAGDFGGVIELLSRAIKSAPEQPIYYNNLAIALQETGQLEQAVANYQKAIALKPDYADALNNYGTALQELENQQEAADCFRQALAIKPDYADAHGNLGCALQELGSLEEAVTCYRKALSINPNFAKAHSNLGVVLQLTGCLDEAVASFHQALAIDPHDIKALCNLGCALNELGRMDQALASFEKALALDAANADTHNNLGIALQDLGRLDEAAACYQKALSLDPDFAVTHSNLIFIQDLFADLDQAAQQAERKRWDDAFVKPLAGNIKPHINTRDENRRLRIGYVSADFKLHSACQGFAPLILDHDREDFEVFCYAGNAVQDPMTEALRGAATAWRSSLGLSGEALAGIIRDDAIDILVDLSGHTKGARLQAFGLKPAPIQVTGVGHMPPGISTIDYRLTTVHATPREEEPLIPEEPIYLETYFGFRPPSAPPLRPTSGPVTFGCLNRFSKITDRALALWAEILGDVAGSKLLIKASQMSEAPLRRRVIDFFSQRGVGEERLVLLGKSSHADHLDAYNRVDISLDTFPQGGGVTTLESLWMGTPVVGLLDSSKIIGRQIAFICAPLGLGDWIAESADEYRKIAVDWAGRRQDIQDLGAEMRDRIVDVYGRFPRDVEVAYRVIWKRWCREAS